MTFANPQMMEHCHTIGVQLSNHQQISIIQKHAPNNINSFFINYLRREKHGLYHVNICRGVSNLPIFHNGLNIAFYVQQLTAHLKSFEGRPNPVPLFI